MCESNGLRIKHWPGSSKMLVVPSPTLAFFLAETQVLERSFESCLPTIPTLSKPSHSSLLLTMMTTILIVTL